ncbi:hypothetical protein [Phocaeicola coprophilus]|jgi:hypothetical protein|uniref:hypothetical protein n=1 Tax=Phocaeicola coprophilus TaxID=387090 RepID=UPI00266B4D83|nr:hypothetical protein [Phocaeicola coprophilus]
MKKEKEKAKYESPSTKKTQVNLESGFMSASIFDKENGQDDGVSIDGHEVGNTGDYTDIGWDNAGTQTNSAW